MADTETFKCHLVVMRPFHNPHVDNGDGKPKGQAMKVSDTITDPEIVKKILGSHHASFVTKVPDNITWDKDEEGSKPDGAEKKSLGKPDGKVPTTQPGGSTTTA